MASTTMPASLRGRPGGPRGLSRRGHVACLLALALLSHFLFSRWGFNPTDDGVVLAVARRLLDGQLPHRDFITPRPILSSLLHLPVLAGGAYTLWLSRLVVWLEITLIVMAWVTIGELLTGRKSGLLARVFWSVLAFTATVHDFPILAWTTIDGVLLISVGLYLAVGNPRWHFVGYLLLGAACITKQSFIFAAPASLLLLGRYRQPSAWLGIVLPGLSYLGWLALGGALGDFFMQILARKELVRVGLLGYINTWTALGVLLGAGSSLLVHLSANGDKAEVRSAAGNLAMAVPAALVVWGLLRGTWLSLSFVLFGMVAVRALVGLIRDPGGGGVRLAGLALLTAWSASISAGYNSPALGSAALLVYWFATLQPALDPLRWTTATAAALVLASLVSFGWARLHSIYRDRPPDELTHPLGDVLAVGAGIRTNPVTFAFLGELEALAEEARSAGMTHVVTPGVAARQIDRGTVNVVSVDWGHGGEVPSEALRERVVAEISARRGSVHVLVQKREPAYLARRTVPLRSSERNFVAAAVRASWEMVRETEFFEVYR